MPGRMELDFVDPVAETIVRAEARRVLVRQAPPLERLTAEKPAELARALDRPAGAVTLEPFGERPVLSEQVVTLERRRLVQDSKRLFLEVRLDEPKVLVYCA